MNHRVIALSTMWGIGRYEHMAPFVQKVHEMGFTHVEVNYQVTEAMLEELKACPGLAVSSVHSPCPGRELADGRWTYRLRMTSEEEDEWRPALQAALDTVDTARALGAPVVVLHVGSVPLDQGLEPRLREMYNNGQAHTPGFVELRDLLLAQREARKGPYLQTAFERVRRVADYASDRGIKVGLESRYYFHEIPNLEEMLSFMNEFGAAGYWHDVGHAENLERLGFTPHQHWLKALASRIIGLHLHDINGLSDHKAPGKGDLNLAAVAPYVPNGAIRVCELASSNTEQEVRAALDVLRRAGVI